jgi:hypothetical protein
MTDIRVNNEYVTVKDSEGNLIISEFFESARIETEQNLTNTKNLSEVKEAFAISEGDSMQKNKLYAFKGSVIQPKDNIIMEEDKLTDSGLFITAVSVGVEAIEEITETNILTLSGFAQKQTSEDVN